MIERITNLRAAMRTKKLDAVLISSAVNIRFISGFTSSDGIVLVTENSMRLFSDFRYIIQANQQLVKGFDFTEITRANQYEKLGDALEADGVQRLGFEDSTMAFADYQAVMPLVETLVPFSEELDRLRVIKTADEVAALKKAQAIADKAYSTFLDGIKPGMSERDLCAELVYICTKLGSEGPAFEPIIGSGPNSAMCHAVVTDRKIKRGDLVVVDFGCVVDGYRSDMTRTFGVGKIDPELVTVYQIVREAQELALRSLRAGINGKALDAIAREYITDKGYGEHFGHGLGHGIGLEVHEAPSASEHSKDNLAPGMTITIEPGIYLEGRGGVRIEDCCVVTENGFINLVSSAKDLIII